MPAYEVKRFTTAYVPAATLAEAGSVKTHAMTIRRATPQRTALRRCGPADAHDRGGDDLRGRIGMPRLEAAWDHQTGARLGGEPIDRRRRMALAVFMMMRHAARCSYPSR